MKRIIDIPKKIIRFIRSIIDELKLVEFPTKTFTIKNTHLVIIVSLLIAVTLLLMDGLFNYARNYLTLNI